MQKNIFDTGKKTCKNPKVSQVESNNEVTTSKTIDTLMFELPLRTEQIKIKMEITGLTPILEVSSADPSTFEFSENRNTIASSTPRYSMSRNSLGSFITPRNRYHQIPFIRNSLGSSTLRNFNNEMPSKRNTIGPITSKEFDLFGSQSPSKDDYPAVDNVFMQSRNSFGSLKPIYPIFESDFFRESPLSSTRESLGGLDAFDEILFKRIDQVKARETFLKHQEFDFQVKELEFAKRQKTLLERERNLMEKQMELQKVQHVMAKSVMARKAFEGRAHVVQDVKTKKKKKSLLSMLGFKKSSKLEISIEEKNDTAQSLHKEDFQETIAFTADIEMLTEVFV